MEYNAVWQSLREPATQHVHGYSIDNGSWFGEPGGVLHHMRGFIVGVLDHEPSVVITNISMDAAWRVRRFNVYVQSHDARVNMQSDGVGNWIGSWARDGDFNPLPEFAGCIDIDISATPSTNTLPIQRLQLAIGESADIDVLYVSVPSLEVGRMKQRYTRLAEHNYRYESVEHGEVVFKADMVVDDMRLVIDYPGLFRRVYPEAIED